MPIGKNAIKRVENNGYSKVETSAPDMENSSVIANIDPQVVEKIIAPVEKKTRAKKAKAEVKIEAPVEAAPATVEKPKRKYVRKAKVAVEPAPEKPKRKYVRKAPVEKTEDKFGRVEVGQGMPYYLL